MILPSYVVKTLASGPAAGYYAVQKLRAKAYDWRLLKARTVPVPVISVGNILMGGSGKTPLVICLAEMMLVRGMKPAVVSRGYRGTYRAPYLVVADGACSTPLVGPSECGDEPYLIALRLPGVPVIVGRQRVHPVTAAHALFHSDVVILDDGFQHLALKRDANIVLITGREDRMFPLGQLREPLSALVRADMAVLAGMDTEIPVRVASYLGDVPVFHSRQRPLGLVCAGDAAPAEVLAGKDVTLVSGIANPQRFKQTALELGWHVIHHIEFPDHHRFNEAELEHILANAGASAVVVTEKDWVKIPGRFKKSGEILALRIEAVIEEEDLFWEALSRRLRRADAAAI